MSVFIYNTLTQKKELFVPLIPHKINFYVCGVTVYDYCHLGHGRMYTALDVIVRYLKFKGYEVTYVRNITDVDDKIIKRANETNESFSTVAERFAIAMNEDFNALGLAKPTSEPKATEYIPKMITLIHKILDNQQAYIAENGDVYFDVRRSKHYGCLSHHHLDELESGARVEVSEVKRDPLDFVLWKLAKPGEPAWESPWGLGRPGWHIECSAMSMDLLGNHFDIHAGGRDLIFPHHENELAQSSAAENTPFVNVWMHVGFLQIGKEKMSKSLGNFVTIREALQDAEPEVLRYFLLASHYRSPLIYTDEAIQQMKHSLTRLYIALRFLPEQERLMDSGYEKAFIEAMDDDFNTPVALAVLFEIAHEIQRTRDKDTTLAAKYAALLKYLGGVLGILQTDPNLFFQTDETIDVERVQSLIAARQLARQQKNWAEADRIRYELDAMSIIIEDSAGETTWRKK